MKDVFSVEEMLQKKKKLSRKRAIGQYLNLQDWRDQKEMNSLNVL